MMSSKRSVLLIAVTSPASMVFFKGQIEYLQRAGFDIAVVCSPGWQSSSETRYYPIAMEREISPLSDLISLFQLTKQLLKIKPLMVNAGTPKAGLLVILAAFLAGVPIKIYTCHGLRLETTTGWKKKLLTLTEKITAYCADKIVCVSGSLRQKYVQMNLARENKVIVIGHGSCNGIDLGLFKRNVNCSVDDFLRKLPAGKSISGDALFIGFIGRLTRDKGIYELVAAFESLKSRFPNLYLLLLGDFEEGDPIMEETCQKIYSDDRIINLGWVFDPISYYQLMKILVLPTYREGLPTVLLEAAAMELPVVATYATGCTDVVVEGETGLLVPIGDSDALVHALGLLLQNINLCKSMGKKARERTEELFGQEMVWRNSLQFYTKLLAEHNNKFVSKISEGKL